MFFLDLCIHRQCGFAVCFPESWRRQTPTHQKGYHAALVLDVCFAVLAFLVIETLHTQISSLFLGKDGTALAYQVSGDYMRWLGYFSSSWVSRWQPMEFFAVSELCVRSSLQT